MPRRDEDVEVPVVGRLSRDAAFSFCGGAGGSAAPAGGVGAPSGPSGSSTASSFVDCVPYCRRRGPRPAGERGAADALGAELAAALFGVGDSVLDSSLSCFGASCADREGTSAPESVSCGASRARVSSYLPRENHHRDPWWCDWCWTGDRLADVSRHWTSVTSRQRPMREVRTGNGPNVMLEAHRSPSRPHKVEVREPFLQPRRAHRSRDPSPCVTIKYAYGTCPRAPLPS